MSKDEGFARGDIDPAFELDEKFRALRIRLTPERYHQACSVYWHTVAAMWRKAERTPAVRVVLDAPAGAVDELIAEGLLDAEGRIPARAFRNSVGRALSKRRDAAERQARKRAGLSREVTRDSRAPERESVRLGTVGDSSSSSSSVVRGGGSGGSHDDDPFDEAIGWLAQHWVSVSPGSATGTALAQLADQHGAARLIEVFEQLRADNEAMRDGAQFVYGARKVLNPIPDVRGNGRVPAKGLTNTEDLTNAVERV